MIAAERPAPGFGARMKRTREERGVSLRRIADRTKLSVGALEALERDDISRLPGGIFSRAFVRSYAAEIGLEPEQALRDFLAQFPDDRVSLGRPRAGHDTAEASAAERRGGTMAFVLTVAMAVIIIALVALAISRP